MSGNNSTTGGGSTPSSNTANYAVLALSTMLSCVQFYNVSEFIPEEAIQALKFFTDYEKLASGEASQFGKPFQRLAILVRDFKQSDDLIYGIDGGNKLLERALRVQKESFISDEKKTFRDIRLGLQKCFINGASGYLLPHPGPKVADSSTQFRGHVKGT